MKRCEILNIANKLSVISETIPDINNGGCGIFAYNAFNNFKKIGINPKIFVMCPLYFQPTTIENFKIFRWYHIVLKVDNLFIDSTGVIGQSKGDLRKLYDKKKMAITKISFDMLSELIENKQIWNRKYDTNKNTLVKHVVEYSTGQYDCVLFFKIQIFYLMMSEQAETLLYQRCNEN